MLTQTRTRCVGFFLLSPNWFPTHTYHFAIIQERAGGAAQALPPRRLAEFTLQAGMTCWCMYDADKGLMQGSAWEGTARNYTPSVPAGVRQARPS